MSLVVPRHARSSRSEVKVTQSCPTLRPHGLPNLWNSPGQNTGVGGLSLLQWIFPTQRSNPGLLHCRWILYQLSYKGSPRILEWVTYPSSSRSSRPGIKPVSPALEGRFLHVTAFDEFYLWIIVHMDS